MELDLAPPPEAAFHVLDRQRYPGMHMGFHDRNRDDQIVFQNGGADSKGVQGDTFRNIYFNKIAGIQIEKRNLPFPGGGGDPAYLQRFSGPDPHDRTLPEFDCGPGLLKSVNSGRHYPPVGDHPGPGRGDPAGVGF